MTLTSTQWNAAAHGALPAAWHGPGRPRLRHGWRLRLRAGAGALAPNDAHVAGAEGWVAETAGRVVGRARGVGRGGGDGAC